MNLTRLRHGLALTVVIFLGLSSCSREEKPSLILIAIDTLRTDALGCYGAAVSATPNLDRLAKECAFFTAAYSQSPWTLPAFASLFTATLPSVHGARGSFQDQFYPIRKGLTLAAESFKNQGYRTAAIVNNIFLKGAFGFKAGFDEYDFYPAKIDNIRKAVEVSHLGRTWLEEHGGVHEPYFLFLHYFDPHFAYLPPPSFQKQYGGNLNERIRSISHPEDIRTNKVTLNAWDRESLRNLYWGEVAYTDQEVGKLLDHLRESGILDEAVVVILSDHGEEFWDHGGFEHGHTQHEELVRVPLMIRFPHGDHAGKLIETPVRLMDLMPTLHEYLELEPPRSFMGDSFLKVIQGVENDSTGPLLFECLLYGSEKKALRAKNLKIVVEMETGDSALYDLEADPEEKQDLADRLPEACAKLKEGLLTLVEHLEKTTVSDEDTAQLSDEDMKALRDLGYTK